MQLSGTVRCANTHLGVAETVFLNSDSGSVQIKKSAGTVVRVRSLACFDWISFVAKVGNIEIMFSIV